MDRKADFAFELPPAQIAQEPTAARDAARLLVVGPPLADARFVELAERLPRDAVVIVNDARVVPARLRTRKPSGGAIELLFVEPIDRAGPAGHVVWRCLAKGGVRAGQALTVDADPATTVTVDGDRDDAGAIAIVIPLPDEAAVYAWLDRVGELPLPPYIERAAGPSDGDRSRYQTMFARAPGAVAAPTAGLHMTPAVAAAITARGGTIAPLTLHVGLGTFAPIRVDALAEHAMHTERFDIPAATAALVASGRPIVAIGTTVVRALESAARGQRGAREVAAGPGATALFIRPGIGYRFRTVDALVTNFHLPESTLLMLVTAFGGYDRVMAAYRHAVAADYRFFSYGDAMLLERADP